MSPAQTVLAARLIAKPRSWADADAFRAIMVAFVVATAVVPLWRQVTPPTPPGPSH
jgi:hypothetical protein